MRKLTPAVHLELSIKALSAYGIEPNIIKSMLSNLEKVAKADVSVSFPLSEFEIRLFMLKDTGSTNTAMIEGAKWYRDNWQRKRKIDGTVDAFGGNER